MGHQAVIGEPRTWTHSKVEAQMLMKTQPTQLQGPLLGPATACGCGASWRRRSPTWRTPVTAHQEGALSRELRRFGGRGGAGFSLGRPLLTMHVARTVFDEMPRPASTQTGRYLPACTFVCKDVEGTGAAYQGIHGPGSVSAGRWGGGDRDWQLRVCISVPGFQQNGTASLLLRSLLSFVSHLFVDAQANGKLKPQFCIVMLYLMISLWPRSVVPHTVCCTPWILLRTHLISYNFNYRTWGAFITRVILTRYKALEFKSLLLYLLRCSPYFNSLSAPSYCILIVSIDSSTPYFSACVLRTCVGVGEMSMPLIVHDMMVLVAGLIQTFPVKDLQLLQK
jgi:hypothetical protein